MNIICKHTSEFNVQYWTVILFLYFPYPIMKRIQLTVPCFMKGHFHISCLELHDLTPLKPKIFWGGPHTSPPRQIYKIKTTMSSVCLCRDACNCTQWPTKKPIFLQKGKRNRIINTFCFLSSSCVCDFFFACQTFRKVWTPTPWRKFLDPRLIIIIMWNIIFIQYGSKELWPGHRFGYVFTVTLNFEIWPCLQIKINKYKYPIWG